MLARIVLFCAVVWISVADGEQECKMISRPAQLVDAERKCESEIKLDESVVNATFRKIQDSFKNAFNATRSLISSIKERFDSDKSSTTTETPTGNREISQPKNCEYYECVFREIKVVDENGTANAVQLSSWIADNAAASLDPKKVKICLEDYAGVKIDMEGVMTDNQAKINDNAAESQTNKEKEKKTSEKIEESVRETFSNMASGVQSLNRQMHIKLQHALTGKEQACLQTEGLMRCLSTASLEKCQVFQY